MEIILLGGSEVFYALSKTGLKIRVIDDGYTVYATKVADVQKVVAVAVALGLISR